MRQRRPGATLGRRFHAGFPAPQVMGPSDGHYKSLAVALGPSAQAFKAPRKHEGVNLFQHHSSRSPFKESLLKVQRKHPKVIRSPKGGWRCQPRGTEEKASSTGAKGGQSSHLEALRCPGNGVRKEEDFGGWAKGMPRGLQGKSQGGVEDGGINSEQPPPSKVAFLGSALVMALPCPALAPLSPLALHSTPHRFPDVAQRMESALFPAPCRLIICRRSCQPLAQLSLQCKWLHFHRLPPPAPFLSCAEWRESLSPAGKATAGHAPSCRTNQVLPP